MSGTMKQLLLAGLLMFLASMTPVLAQSRTVTTSSILPIRFVLSHPCSGEDIALSGELHLVSSVTLDASGGTHVEFQANFQGVSGVGLATGDRYQLNGERLHTSFNTSGAPPFEMTITSNAHLIGQGPDNNFLLHFLVHTTVNANGAVTAAIDELRVECS